MNEMNCENCIHKRICDLWSEAEGQTASCYVDDCFQSAADVVPVVHETPMLRYRPERYERYDEYGLNENGEMLYVKQVLVDEKSYAMYCPACGKRLCSRFRSFCPNCGAKMDGGQP